MGQKTSIQWTDRTWNPVTGCTKVSQGCKHCYAERIFARPYPGRKFTDVRCHPERLAQPLSWRTPSKIFVNSMSDLFHEDVPDAFLVQVFAVMMASSFHTFQVLTKRAERMRSFLSQSDLPDQIADEIDRAPWAPLFKDQAYLRTLTEVGLRNRELWPCPDIWLGVSVENQDAADARIPLLLQTPATVRFLSVEPMLGPITLCTCAAHLPGTMGHLPSCALRSLQWVICGGESGPRARHLDPQWAVALKAQCEVTGVPFFFKQGSQTWLKNFKDFGSFPQVLQVREFPR